MEHVPADASRLVARIWVEGIVTETIRPSPSRGRPVAVPLWIAVMDATMARPNQTPSCAVRRALGATKGHIRVQFLAEAILLAFLGGAAGVGTGSGATAINAITQHWAVVIPTVGWAGGLAAAVAIEAVAGLVPAWRAARMSPTRALWSI